MAWLFIILAIVLVIGPVLYLKPTAKDKRLSGLRLRARAKGLDVSLASLPKLDPEPSERVSAGGVKLDPTRPCAAYRLAHEVDALSAIKAVRLLRIPDAVTVPIRPALAAWCTTPGEVNAWLSMRGQLERRGTLHAFERLLDHLPEEVVGWGCDPRFLACFWLENAPEDTHLIDVIYDGLREMRTLLDA